MSIAQRLQWGACHPDSLLVPVFLFSAKNILHKDTHRNSSTRNTKRIFSEQEATLSLSQTLRIRTAQPNESEFYRFRGQEKKRLTTGITNTGVIRSEIESPRGSVGGRPNNRSLAKDWENIESQANISPRTSFTRQKLNLEFHFYFLWKYTITLRPDLWMVKTQDNSLKSSKFYCHLIKINWNFLLQIVCLSGRPIIMPHLYDWCCFFVKTEKARLMEEGHKI